MIDESRIDSRDAIYWFTCQRMTYATATTASKRTIIRNAAIVCCSFIVSLVSSIRQLESRGLPKYSLVSRELPT